MKSTDADGNTVYTLSYRIYEDTENGTNSNGISVVTETYDFTVTVTDHGNGVLTAVTNYPNGQNQFEFGKSVRYRTCAGGNYRKQDSGT